MVCHTMIWFSLVWFGAAWCGVVCFYVVMWHGVYGFVWYGMVWYGKACPAADVAETKQEIGLNQDLTNQSCSCAPIICSERQDILKFVTTNMMLHSILYCYLNW